MAAVCSLRYVEYAYLEVLSINVVDGETGETTSSPDRDLADLSQRIEQTVTSGVCMNRLNEALSIGRKCQIVLKDKAVGLEKLPGQLLPMPKPSTLPHDRPGPASNRAFVVNTIYTKEEVAKVVVEGFMKLVSDQFGEEDDDAKLFVDAGTGGGSLLRNLPPAASIGVDTHPHCTDLDNVLEADFLQLTKAELHGFVADCGKQNSENRRLCIISNPPFSERSRGDYSVIARFINKSVDLGALCIGVIVPTKFARERVWASLGMNKRVKLLARFLLPKNSFYDPASTKEKNNKNIQSVFLFFGIDDDNHNNHASKAIDCETLPNTIHVIGKRDKRLFSEMATADLSTCVARGLENAGAKLASSEVAECSLSAEIKSTPAGILLELDVLLNPKRPLSLTNSTSRLVAEHSLGWVSNSCKPPVAEAMVQLATGCLDDSSPRGCGLFINAMSGEGTIELEAKADDLTSTFFMISGDSDASVALHPKRRLASLAIHSGSGRSKRPRVDMIVWDAQRLPLRRGVADAYLADLPFAGSKKQKHQTPSSSGAAAVGASMDYKRVMGQALTVLKPGGRAVLLSADSKGLSIASRSFNWFERWQSNAVNVGGLSAKMAVMERGPSCYKDISFYVTEDCGNLSESLLKIAQNVCVQFYLDDRLELQERTTGNEVGFASKKSSLILRVQRFDIYVDQDGKHSNGYRLYFDDLISNSGAKQLYKIICAAVEKAPPDGIII
jgi:tRNA1(Val) A37 N6-methylase TrmN6